jgi:16S rRNA (guanine527-N7)-methyltransferase
LADLQAQLSAGAAGLGLHLSSAQFGQLVQYLTLLQKWNKVYNLTAVRNPADMLTHHLLDCLAVVLPLQRQLAEVASLASMPHSQPPSQPLTPTPTPTPLSSTTPTTPAWRLLDVGSGAGLPGVVIAVCCPHIQVDCVDTVAKKAAFINQVAAELKLPNLRGLHARVEGLAADALGFRPYDVISSRAFSSLVDFVGLTQGLLAPAGRWLAMKGKSPAAERAELTQKHPEVEVFHVEQLQVPRLDASRCIVWMRQQ